MLDTNHVRDIHSTRCLTLAALKSKESGVRGRFRDRHSSAAILHQIPGRAASCHRYPLPLSRDAVLQSARRFPCHRRARKPRSAHLLVRKSNPHFPRFRMPEHVRERLLNDAEDSRLDIRRQSGEVSGLDIEEGFDAAASWSAPPRTRQAPRANRLRRAVADAEGETWCELAESRDQSCRWPERRLLSVATASCKSILSNTIFATASSCPSPSCRSRAMRRRSSSCVVIRRTERRRNSSVRRSTIFSNSMALSRIDCSSTLLS